jgi:glycosyltransferase involved in cell wall biosynthesis
MFKVLVIAYYFPPMGLSGVQRTLKFVKYMKNYNWEPTVLTAGATAYYAHDYSLLEEAGKTKIRIIRVGGKDINSRMAYKGTVKMPSEKIRKFLSRISATFFVPDNKKGWCKKAIVKAKELLANEKFDLIFVSGPPFSSFRMAVKLKNEFNLPLLIDYRDLWYGNQFGFYPTPMHKYLHYTLEYAVLKAADKIAVTNRKIKEKLLSGYKFLTFEDVFILPHGFDPEDFRDLSIDKKIKTKMILTYIGIFYEFITPKYFLKAFRRLLIERPEIGSRIELHFAGILRKENERLIKKLELQEYVKNYGYLNHKEALVKAVSSDVLWMMVGRGRNADTVSSGKIYEYFGTRKPILACITEGAVKNSLIEYKSSFIVEPDDIEGIKNMIINVYELYNKNQFPVPDEEFIEKHRRDNLTDELTKQFSFLVKAE